MKFLEDNDLEALFKGYKRNGHSGSLCIAFERLLKLGCLTMRFMEKYYSIPLNLLSSVVLNHTVFNVFITVVNFVQHSIHILSYLLWEKQLPQFS